MPPVERGQETTKVKGLLKGKDALLSLLVAKERVPLPVAAAAKGTQERGVSGVDFLFCRVGVELPVSPRERRGEKKIKQRDKFARVEPQNPHDQELERGREEMVVSDAGGDVAGLRTFEEAKSTLYGTISATGAALESASRCVCGGFGTVSSRFQTRDGVLLTLMFSWALCHVARAQPNAAIPNPISVAECSASACLYVWSHSLFTKFFVCIIFTRSLRSYVQQTDIVFGRVSSRMHPAVPTAAQQDPFVGLV